MKKIIITDRVKQEMSADLLEELSSSCTRRIRTRTP
jgi:hypothetical protein